MNRLQRTAVAVASAALAASVATSCGALETSPISNATANENSAAIGKTNVYSSISRQADAQAERAARTDAEKKAVQEAKKAKEKAEKAKTDPVGTRNDMDPVAETSEIPEWVTAINWAQTKLGHKYIWGGESDAEGGFDCSGLMQAAYAQAGIKLPRVAADQYNTTNAHPKENDLRPGDLVFFGSSATSIHHVGLYLGSGMMIHAPNSRSVIRFDKVHYMSDYYGATRVSM